MEPDTNAPKTSLMAVYEGWEGYQSSLVNAIAPLTSAQLAWRPAPEANSVGEVARHISLGRITWFMRMGAPGSGALARRVKAWETDSDGNQDIVEGAIAITDQASELVRWLEVTWQMIETTLKSWHVSDLGKTYLHKWNGKDYAISRQWTIWRILSHDIHHGGELSLMLGLQGISAFELSDLFGHTILPPLAQDLNNGESSI
jgi:uncharacterized damage-inducible protein DinB